MRTFDPPQLKRSWSETGATWNNASSGVLWATPGAKGATDRDTATIAPVTMSNEGTVEFAIDRTVEQNRVTTPASNFGISIANSAAYDGITVESSEATMVSHRPALHVVLVE